MSDVKYDRQWVYYDKNGEPHSLGFGVPPTGDFDRVLDLQQHLDWVQEQVNKLKDGLPTTAVINNMISPIHVVEWQALDKERKKAEEEAKHWERSYDVASARKDHYWKELQIAKNYLQQIKARMVADQERYHKLENTKMVIDLVDEAFDAMRRSEST